MKGLISIIIPTYNRAQTLKRSISSVVEQTADTWELIIVDDGSTDNTRDLVSPYLIDSRIKYIAQENTGVSTARNAGAALANGDYLIFLDSDDIIYPHLINFLIGISIYQYDIVCWQVVKIIDGCQKIWKPRKQEKMYNGIIASFLAGSVCYNKELFHRVGGYDPTFNFGENYELGLRISQTRNLRIKIIDEPFLQYNLLQEGRTSNSVSNRLTSYIHLYNKHREKYEKDPKSHANITYLLGYIHERNGQLEEAKRFYTISSQTYIFNFKAHLKRLYFTLFK